MTIKKYNLINKYTSKIQFQHVTNTNNQQQCCFVIITVVAIVTTTTITTTKIIEGEKQLL